MAQVEAGRSKKTAMHLGDEVVRRDRKWRRSCGMALVRSRINTLRVEGDLRKFDMADSQDFVADADPREGEADMAESGEATMVLGLRRRTRSVKYDFPEPWRPTRRIKSGDVISLVISKGKTEEGRIGSVFSSTTRGELEP